MSTSEKSQPPLGRLASCFLANLIPFSIPSTATSFLLCWSLLLRLAMFSFLVKVTDVSLDSGTLPVAQVLERSAHYQSRVDQTKHPPFTLGEQPGAHKFWNIRVINQILSTNLRQSNRNGYVESSRYLHDLAEHGDVLNRLGLACYSILSKMCPIVPPGHDQKVTYHSAWLVSESSSRRALAFIVNLRTQPRLQRSGFYWYPVISVNAVLRFSGRSALLSASSYCSRRNDADLTIFRHWSWQKVTSRRFRSNWRHLASRHGVFITFLPARIRSMKAMHSSNPRGGRLAQ